MTVHAGIEAPARPEWHDRPSTPDRYTETGGAIVTVKRICNGCSTELGDATYTEIGAAIAGAAPADVRGECRTCRPLTADLEHEVRAFHARIDDAFVDLS